MKKTKFMTRMLSLVICGILIATAIPFSATAADDAFPDLSGIVDNAEITTLTDFDTVGAGTLENTTVMTLTDDKRVSYVRNGDWWGESDWAFAKSQDLSSAKGFLVKVDFASANTGTNGGHGVSIAIHTEDGRVYNDSAKGGYAFAGGIRYDMTSCVKYPDLLVVNKDVKQKYTGFVFIPMSTYGNVSGLDKVDRISLKVGTVTSGTAYVDEIFIVEGETFLDGVVDNAETVILTNFNAIGSGTLENATHTVLTEDHRIAMTRSGGEWWRESDWAFDEAQDISNAKGFLVKVDFSAANVNSTATNGGHGVSIAIHTDEGKVYNDSAKGGYALLDIIRYDMTSCEKYPDLLVVPQTVKTKYVGFVYIPMSAYRVAASELDEIDRLTIKIGACTSGTAYVDEILLVTGDDPAPAVEIEGIQDTKAQGGDTFDVRFLASINTLNAKNYSYEISAIYSVPTEEKPIETTWNMGYVSTAGLLTGGSNYSRSDIITIEKAGTVVKFVDPNATGVASGSALVVSIWKQVDGEWVLDTDRTQYAGGSSIQSTVGDTVIYTYTTQQDNEAIRLCYRSEQTVEGEIPEVATVVITHEGFSVSKKYEGLNTVYTGVIADGELVNAYCGTYYAPVTIKGIPQNVNVKFTIKCSLTFADGTVVASEPVEYEVVA